MDRDDFEDNTVCGSVQLSTEGCEGAAFLSAVEVAPPGLPCSCCRHMHTVPSTSRLALSLRRRTERVSKRGCPFNCQVLGDKASIQTRLSTYVL
jgi:hypothetical protein